jgi:hypothetical protein
LFVGRTGFRGGHFRTFLGRSVGFRRRTNAALVHREFDRISRGTRTEIVHAGLQTLENKQLVLANAKEKLHSTNLFPGIEMHRREFVHVWLSNVNIQRLRLIDECTSIGSHVDDHFLRDFPNCFVQRFDIIRNGFDVLQTRNNKTIVTTN